MKTIAAIILITCFFQKMIALVYSIRFGTSKEILINGATLCILAFIAAGLNTI